MKLIRVHRQAAESLSKGTSRIAIVNHLGAALLMALGISFLWSACSFEEGPSREVRGHTENFRGVAHGKFADKALRYCTKCHGTQLLGGDNGEFSCFKCHAQKWQPSEVRYSPDSHTELRGGKWFHHPGGLDAKTNCVSCHGANLTGSTGPSCVLCHDPKWPE